MNTDISEKIKQEKSMTKLYCIVFREYQNIDAIRYFAEKYGVFGHRWTKELFFHNLDDVYRFLEKFWIFNNQGWRADDAVHVDLKNLRQNIDKHLGIHCPILSANQFGCEIMLIVVPDIEDVMNSPLLLRKNEK